MASEFLGVTYCRKKWRHSGIFIVYFEDITLLFLLFLLLTLNKWMLARLNPGGIYLLKVNSGSTRTVFEICSKLTIKTPERRHWRCYGVFIEQVNAGQVVTLNLSD